MIKRKRDHTCVEEELPGSRTYEKLNQQTKWTRMQRFSHDIWLWEMLSVIVSIACVSAILIILLHYDGKQVPNWKWGLIINGIVSFLSPVAKSAMILPIAEAISQLKWNWFRHGYHPILDFDLLDDASRGPWGCAVLLTQPHLWSLASVGAALTVSAMLMESALQLIPSFPLRMTASGEATILRADYYSDWNTLGEDADCGPVENCIKDQLGRLTKVAFYDGVFGDERSQTITPDCPTGNCTWPVYSTLAVCDYCQNVSSALAYHFVDPGDAEANWWLMNGTSAPAGQQFEDGARAQIRSALYRNDGPGSMSFNHTFNQVITDMYYYYRLPLGAADARPTAFECKLWFCVKTYTANVTDGMFKETEVSSWPPWNMTLPDEPDVRNPSGLYFAPQDNTFAKRNFTIDPPNQDETYSVDTVTITILNFWLADILASSSDSASSSVHPSLSSDLTEAIYNSQVAVDGIAGANIHSNNQSVTMVGPQDAINSIANSLTTNVRMNGFSNGAAKGIVYETEAYVLNRWLWSICPIALVSLTSAFVLSTVVVSHRQNVPMWKSSALTTLLHGLDAQTSLSISDNSVVATSQKLHSTA